MTATDQDLVEVRLLGLPLPLLAEAQERSDELVREFSHVAQTDSDAAPARLVALSEQLRGRYASSVAPAQEQIDAAIARGDETVDVSMRVPRTVKGHVAQLWALLDEADEYCRGGDLLTLAPPPEVVTLRRWYLSQFIDQVDGAEPVPYSRYAQGSTA